MAGAGRRLWHRPRRFRRRGRRGPGDRRAQPDRRDRCRGRIAHGDRRGADQPDGHGARRCPAREAVRQLDGRLRRSGRGCGTLSCGAGRQRVLHRARYRDTRGQGFLVDAHRLARRRRHRPRGQRAGIAGRDRLRAVVRRAPRGHAAAAPRYRFGADPHRPRAGQAATRRFDPCAGARSPGRPGTRPRRHRGTRCRSAYARRTGGRWHRDGLPRPFRRRAVRDPLRDGFRVPVRPDDQPRHADDRRACRRLGRLQDPSGAGGGPARRDHARRAVQRGGRRGRAGRGKRARRDPRASTCGRARGSQPCDRQAVGGR